MSLISVRFKASQWYEMFGHDPEVMGLNPNRVNLGDG